VQIRAAELTDVAAIAKVHVDSWRTTYTGIVPDDFLANSFYERRERLWRNTLSEYASTNFVYVAEDDGGNIIGFVSGGKERNGDTVYTGELYTIYLLDQYQRQGVGRQLTVRLVKRLIQEGMTSLLVWVLAVNPSRKFYEVLGGQQVYQKSITSGDVQLIEVGYGWRNAHIIIDERE
jgi:GNAT superfamily N-acetyltransferase